MFLPGIPIKYTADAVEAGQLLDSLTGSVFGFDIETYGTDGLDIYQNATRLMQFWDGNTSIVIDVAITGMIPQIKRILEDPGILKVIQNGKFEYKQLWHQYKIKVKNIWDTMIGHQVIFAGLHHTANLLYLMKLYFNWEIDKDPQGWNWGGVLEQRQLVYAGNDPFFNVQAYQYQVATIQNMSPEEQTLMMHTLQLEFELIPIIAEMEIFGVFYDKSGLNNLGIKIKNEADNTLREIQSLLPPYQLAWDFKPGKANKWWTKTGKPTKKHRELYPNGLKYPETKDEFGKCLESIGVQVPKNEETDNYIINKSTYGRIDHPSMKLMQKWYSEMVIYNTFCKGFLEKHFNPVTGRVHTNWIQVKSTGRMGSSDPNYQNIPRKYPGFRKLLYAPQGWSIVKADYSQAELRVLAEISEDSNLIDAYLNDKDVHAKTAAKIYGRREEDYKDNKAIKEERQLAKNVNFGEIYDQKAPGLKEYLWKEAELDISLDDAKKFRKAFFQTFPGVERWHNFVRNQVIDSVLRTGNFSIKTLRGRTRFWKDLDLKAYTDKYTGEVTHYMHIGEMLNLPIQGTVGDIMKMNMVRLSRELLNEWMIMILQVHDELVFLVKNEYLEFFAYHLERIMVEEAQKLITKVPMKVDVTIGYNWAGDNYGNEAA